MRIAIHSDSAAIRRILEAVIAQAGHHFCLLTASPDLVLHDTLHPPTSTLPNTTILSLVANENGQENAITCPLRPNALIQRLRILGSNQCIPLAQGWSLDMQARSLIHATAASLTLTEKECYLLKHLAAAHPTPMTRENLLDQVWGMAGDIDTHTLETHIYRLRAKLEPLLPIPCDIVTQDGAYLLALGEKDR